jgi:peptidoglycan/xylan/chitin deacetylase (PgdA/CDA1 family)
MPIGKRELLANVLQGTGANFVLARTRVWHGLTVLNYHRIGEPGESVFDPGLFSATAEQFAAQVRFLTRNFDVIGIRELSGWEQRRGRFVMITFDDGYLDNYESAYPILRADGAPGVFFLTSGFLDDDRVAWWDEISWMLRTSRRDRIAANPWTIGELRLSATDLQRTLDRLLRIYKSLPGRRTSEFLTFLADGLGTGRCPAGQGQWMTWSLVREMQMHGMEFGGHKCTHPVLANLTRGEQEQEVRECRTRIETELGRPISAFSYPVGQRDSFNATTQACLREVGYRWAFSYYGGFNRGSSVNPFDLRRVAIESHTSAAMFCSVACLPHVFA